MNLAGHTAPCVHTRAHTDTNQLHDDPMVGALLQLASDHAQQGELWSLTVSGDGTTYTLARIAEELDGSEVLP